MDDAPAVDPARVLDRHQLEEALELPCAAHLLRLAERRSAEALERAVDPRESADGGRVPPSPHERAPRTRPTSARPRERRAAPGRRDGRCPSSRRPSRPPRPVSRRSRRSSPDGRPRATSEADCRTCRGGPCARPRRPARDPRRRARGGPSASVASAAARENRVGGRNSRTSSQRLAVASVAGVDAAAGGLPVAPRQDGRPDGRPCGREGALRRRPLRRRPARSSCVRSRPRCRDGRAVRGPQGRRSRPARRTLRRRLRPLPSTSPVSASESALRTSAAAAHGSPAAACVAAASQRLARTTAQDRRRARTATGRSSPSSPSGGLRTPGRRSRSPAPAPRARAASACCGVNRLPARSCVRRAARRTGGASRGRVSSAPPGRCRPSRSRGRSPSR